jgi:hypothetical protein
MVAVAWAMLLLLVVVVAMAQAAHAQDHSERIGRVRIDATLQPDGSMRVVEEREFVYQGSFEGAFYELPILRDEQRVTLHELSDDRGTAYRPGRCSPNGAKQPGRYELSSEGFRLTWCWDPPPTDATRTIILDYTVAAAGVRHEDSSELYGRLSVTGGMCRRRRSSPMCGCRPARACGSGRISR